MRKRKRSKTEIPVKRRRPICFASVLVKVRYLPVMARHTFCRPGLTSKTATMFTLAHRVLR